jgi:cyclopropane fatty-acyl-phospholipid synthase-like methyltransferase
MMRRSEAYFEKLYAEDPDPWGFESRWYETRKYDLTLAALPRQHYGRAFEPGCANGVLTDRLAARCDCLVATEIVASVRERAKKRLARHAHVEVRALAIPEQWPEGRFELIVLSEIVYYLTAEGLAALLDRIDASLAPGGHVVAVHFIGRTDYPLTGLEVHDSLDAHAPWRGLARYLDDAFILSVYEARPT